MHPATPLLPKCPDFQTDPFSHEVQVDGGRGDPSRPGDTVNGCPFVALFQENTSGCLQNLFPDIALHASPPPFKFNC